MQQLPPGAARAIEELRRMPGVRGAAITGSWAAEHDALKMRYLVSTNAWILLEAVWAANDRPMPPTATAYRRYTQLGCVPFPGWFEELFHENDAHRMEATRRIIAWAAERLEK